MDYKEKVLALLNDNNLSLEQKMKIESIFPELKESEESKDEKIRKVLINMFKGYDIQRVGDFTDKEIIAWLEKQPIEEVNGEDYGIDSLWHAQRILEKTLGMVDGYQTDDGVLEHKAAITAVKKLYEQKPVEPFKAEYGKYYYCIKDFYSGGNKRASKGDVVQALCGLPIMGLDDASEYFLPVNSIEQKPAEWSEEDDYYQAFIIELLYGIEDNDKDYENKCRKAANWLKSLRPQKQQEWTQADKNFMNAAIAFVQQNKSFNCWGGVNKKGVIAFLQSLRPQKQWKPSEEQLTELRCVISGCSYETSVLVELEKQLKSLL